MATSTETGYVAGFLDGEGCITSIFKRKTSGAVVADVIVVLTNTDRDVLSWMRKLYRVGRLQEKKYEAHRKTRCWSWIISKRAEILFFLRSMLPFLKIKQQQASLAVLFIESRVKARGASYSDEDLDMLFRLRKLTQRTPGTAIIYNGIRYTAAAFKVMMRQGSFTRRSNGVTR